LGLRRFKSFWTGRYQAVWSEVGRRKRLGFMLALFSCFRQPQDHACNTPTISGYCRTPYLNPVCKNISECLDVGNLTLMYRTYMGLLPAGSVIARQPVSFRQRPTLVPLARAAVTDCLQGSALKVALLVELTGCVSGWRQAVLAARHRARKCTVKCYQVHMKEATPQPHCPGNLNRFSICQVDVPFSRRGPRHSRLL
jgi:hypothetical protein